MVTLTLRRRFGVTLAVLLAVFVVGCELGGKRKVDPVVDLSSDLVMDTYTSDAFDATGGLEAWTETKELKIGCVVTVYMADGTFYLTQFYALLVVLRFITPIT